MPNRFPTVRRLPDLNLSPDEVAPLNPIQQAVLQNEAQILAQLIQTLAPLTSYLQHQLFTAVARGHVAVSRCLLEAGSEVDSRVVFAACYKARSAEMFQLLLDSGWNVNADFDSGMPALGWVLKDEELVQWFLDHGADPRVGKKEQWNPGSPLTFQSGQLLDFAACGSTLSVFELLLRHGAQLELSLALHNAAGTKFTDERRKLMQFLIEERHVNINQLDTVLGPRKIGSPLFYAARNGNIEGVKLLLDYGANAALKNHRAVTAADEAERFGKKAVVDLLRQSRIL